MVLLKTKRLIIREFKPSDWKEVHEYASDPQVVRYLAFGPNTIAETKKHVQKMIKERKIRNRKHYNFAICIKKTKKAIGACRISIKDAKNGRGDIGYVLNRNYWNNGYMTEAVKALVKFGLGGLKLHRITAICRPKNLASKRVMEKVGMRKEAHFRKHIFHKDKWHDSYQFAILEDERGKRL